MGNQFFSKIAKQGIFNVIILVAANLMGFLTTVVKTKAFTPNDIGLYALIVNIASLLSLITLLGLPSLYIKYIPGLFMEKNSGENRRKISTIILYSVALNLALSLIAFSIFFIFQDFFVKNFFGSNIKANTAVMVGLMLLATNLLTILSMLLRACYKSSTSNFYMSIFLRGLVLLVLFICIQFRITIYQFIYLYIAINFFTGGILFIKLRKLDVLHFQIPDRKTFQSDEYKEMIHYMLMMFLASTASGFIYKMDTLMLGYFKDTYSTGIYEIALVIGNLLGAVSTGVAMIAHPVIAGLLREDNMKDLKRIYVLTARWSMILCIPVFFVMIFFSKNILNVLGRSYMDGYMVLIIIALGQLINISAGMCGGIIALSRYFQVDFYTQLALLLLNFIMNSLFIPRYGMVGAAAATAISLGFYNIIKLLFVYRTYGILPYNKKSIYLAFISVITAWMVYRSSLIFGQLRAFQIIWFTLALYGIFFIMTALFLEKEEKDMLRAVLDRIRKRG